MQLSNYSKIWRGEWILTMPIVCNNGLIQSVRIEQFTDGFHAYLNVNGVDYTNHKGYKTARKAINAAAKWEV